MYSLVCAVILSIPGPLRFTDSESSFTRWTDGFANRYVGLLPLVLNF